MTTTRQLNCPYCGEPQSKEHKAVCLFTRDPEYPFITMAPNDPRRKRMLNDPVNHPSHYTEHASGIECIQITEHMNFCLGNAVKYIWRAGLKNDNAIEDLKKARWYVDRELERLSK